MRQHFLEPRFEFFRKSHQRDAVIPNRLSGEESAFCVCSLADDQRLTTNDYLSISPNTMSMLPMAATTSAISLPSHIVGKVCMFARQAERICTRYGFAEPSLTM